MVERGGGNDPLQLLKSVGLAASHKLLEGTE